MLAPIIILTAIAVVVVGQSVHFYPYLPDLVISHWGPGGQPDGWLNKTAFFWAMIISELGTGGFIAASAFAVPYLKNSFEKLPHKDYWLSPERRDRTIQTVRAYRLWLAVIIEAAMVILWQSTINANVPPEFHWPADLWWTLIITALFIIAWIILFKRHFNFVPDTEKET